MKLYQQSSTKHNISFQIITLSALWGMDWKRAKLEERSFVGGYCEISVMWAELTAVTRE